MPHDSPINHPTFADTLGELAHRASLGDRDAFDQIHARLAGGVRQLFLKRLGARADLADDLAQRAFLAAWTAISSGRYDPTRSAASTFIYAISLKIWLQHLRAEGRRSRREGPDEAALAAAAGGDEVDQGPAMAELLQVVRDSLSGAHEDLTSQERQILRCVAEGDSDRALAKRLGLAPSTANAKKNAAFEKLRRILGARGFRADSGEQTDSDGE